MTDRGLCVVGHPCFMCVCMFVLQWMGVDMDVGSERRMLPRYMNTHVNESV